MSSLSSIPTGESSSYGEEEPCLTDSQYLQKVLRGVQPLHPRYTRVIPVGRDRATLPPLLPSYSPKQKHPLPLPKNGHPGTLPSKLPKPSEINHSLASTRVAPLAKTTLTATSPSSDSFNGISRKTLKYLRAGRYPAGRTLDLHGDSIDTAYQAITSLLDEASSKHIRSVLIIHGYGKNSPNGVGVLRQYLAVWLDRSPHVLAYTYAVPHLGGEGVTFVLLRRSPT